MLKLFYITYLPFFQPHVLFVVPSLLNLLASHSLVTREHLASIQQVVCGAAPSTISLIEKFYRKVGREDIKVRQGFCLIFNAELAKLIKCGNHFFFKVYCLNK